MSLLSYDFKLLIFRLPLRVINRYLASVIMAPLLIVEHVAFFWQAMMCCKLQCPVTCVAYFWIHSSYACLTSVICLAGVQGMVLPPEGL